MSGSQSTNVREVVLRLRTASFDELPSLLERYGEDPRGGVRSACGTAARRLAIHTSEVDHTRSLYETQREFGGTGIVIGIDEVGRGAVAGPLTVAAVALPDEPMVIGIDDSKKLTPERREELAREIRLHARAIGIAHIPAEDIDACGMSASLRVAMCRALDDCGVHPDAVLVDGNPLHLQRGERYLVKGDGRIAGIAAASIVAKVTRDAFMVLADKDYPGYGFASSKGYASAEHIAAIQERGLCPLHRKTFCEGFLSRQMRLL